MGIDISHILNVSPGYSNLQPSLRTLLLNAENQGRSDKGHIHDLTSSQAVTSPVTTQCSLIQCSCGCLTTPCSYCMLDLYLLFSLGSSAFSFFLANTHTSSRLCSDSSNLPTASSHSFQETFLLWAPGHSTFTSIIALVKRLSHLFSFCFSHQAECSLRSETILS